MRTFLDSGVLLTAWRGKEASATAALRILDDDRRVFVTSQMVKLELLPKPAFFGNAGEVEFYNTHFAAVEQEEPLSAALADEAFILAKTHGLAAADALNMAAALRLRAKEFVTTEAPGKPLYRVPGIKVVTLHAAVR
jgi:predicted nucleic acid-binding protein